MLGDSDGWRMKEFDRRKAAFLTTTLKPVRNMEVRQSNNTYIDINRVKPNGAPNPHFLQPYGDYTFQEGWLKRLRIGAGVRYRGKQVAGFRGADTMVDPANPARAIDDPTINAYTPVYTPDDFYLVTGSLGYSWRFRDGREMRANLVINNLLTDRGPIYGQSTAVRPKNGDYTSPARETVANGYGLKQPISYNLTLTMRL